MDIVFSRFLEQQGATLDTLTIEALEQLLEESDADIWDWITGKSTPPQPCYVSLIAQLKTASINAS